MSAFLLSRPKDDRTHPKCDLFYGKIDPTQPILNPSHMINDRYAVSQRAAARD